LLEIVVIMRCSSAGGFATMAFTIVGRPPGRGALFEENIMIG
jgi:hypothetical protein